jgi:membrane protein
VEQLSEQTSRLARQEVELAKAELQVKGRRAGLGAGMFGSAGVLGLYAIGALLAAAVLALSTAVTAWVSALIVGILLAAFAGILVLRGQSRLQAASPLVPERAIDSTKEDVREARSRAQAGRREH